MQNIVAHVIDYSTESAENPFSIREMKDTGLIESNNV